MKRLWAPWRKKYITEGTGKGCFLCRARRSRKDRESFIIARSKSSFAVLNIYPYNNGHVLVVPNRHVAVLSALKDNEIGRASCRERVEISVGAVSLKKGRTC